jgi:hypothetical protein
MILNQRRPWRLTWIAVATLVALAPGADAAAEQRWKLFGHELSIVSLESMRALKVDGRKVMEAWGFGIEEVAIVDDVGTVIGYVSDGGTMCEANPFVIAFPEGEAPRIDGPLENCRLVDRNVRDDKIVFETPATAQRKGKQWVWSLHDGI